MSTDNGDEATTPRTSASPATPTAPAARGGPAAQETPPGPPARLADLPSRLLSLAAAHAERLVSEGLATAGARKWHYAVLAVLDESGPMSQSALSRRSGIYRSDMVAVINELADAGHADRTPDPTDRRRNVITLTPAGRAHLHHLDALVAAIQDDLLTPLVEADRTHLTALLHRLLTHPAANHPWPAHHAADTAQH